MKARIQVFLLALLITVVSLSTVVSAGMESRAVLIREIREYIDVVNERYGDEANFHVGIDVDRIPLGATFADLKCQVDDLAFWDSSTDSADVPEELQDFTPGAAPRTAEG